MEALSTDVSVVFLDRDGIINRMRHDYVKCWEEFEILPGALDALARLSGAGLRLVVVTNQSAIGRGLVSHATVDAIHTRLIEMARQRGADLAAFLICPHRPDEVCDCRKPAPGLFERARDELGIDLRRAVMIGDTWSDVEAARAAGIRAILVDARATPAAGNDAYRVAGSLPEAVDLILGTR